MCKKMISILLTGVLLLGVLSACTTEEKAEIGIDLSAVEDLEGELCAKEPLNLTIHMHNGGFGAFDNEKWTIYHDAAKRTNISLTGTVSTSVSDGAMAYNLMLLEETLPDIIFHTSGATLNDAGMNEGILIPIEDYVTNEEIMPNLAKIYKEHPEYLAAITAADGHVYYCPKIREPGPTQVWFVRTDWQKKLGLKNPTNFDEFVATMDAIRNGDPNGNGKKDECAYFGKLEHLFYLFGLNGFRYFDVNAEDKFYTPVTSDAYKQALITIADWYKKGYIDQEIYTRKDPKTELWGTNTGAMTVNWVASTMSYNQNIKNIPGFRVDVIAPPENINGDMYCHTPGSTVTTVGWGISKDNQHIAETLKYFDFWYSEAGSLLNAMGVEGRDFYYDENGNEQYTELAMTYDGGAAAYVRTIGCHEIGYYMRQKWLDAGMEESGAAALKMYQNDIRTCDLVPLVNFTVDEQKVYDKKWTDCKTYIDEYQQNVILGNVDVEATWDEYLAQLKEFGCDEVVDLHNTAYERYKKLVK